jgi:periplasmic protein TonB
VFDEVTKQEGGKQAATRFGYVFGSTLFQVAIVVGIIALSSYVKAKVIDEPIVPVTIVKSAAPPPPPPPPAPPPAARKRPPSDKPKTDLPKPPPPQALLQPKEVQEQMKAPDPNEPPEPEYDYDESAAGEGVVGGVVGAAPRNDIEDAPAFATAGYKKPQMAQAGCVQSSMRVPRELAGFVSGPVQVKFAIGKDGVPSRFETLTPVPDRRLADAIWSAVQSCKWVPGADAQGKPTAIWVIMPFRFTGG